jgi:hypothetical protein
MINVGGSDACAELRELNRDTFLAEEKRNISDKSWREFLEQSLADDFMIRRARADLPNQTRQQMLDWIEAASIVERTIRDDETVTWCTDTLGAVVCPIEMVKDGAVHRYQNVKLFRKHPGTFWQCVYWQVTESPTTASVA